MNRLLLGLALACASVPVAAATLPLRVPAIDPAVPVNGVPLGTIQSQAALGASTARPLDQLAHGSAGGSQISPGYFQLNTTQGSTICQAPQAGQLTSPAGVCLQYTPSVQQVGGAGGIFGLQGAISDYQSPVLIVAIAGAVGDRGVTVSSDPSINNLSMFPSAGPSVFTSSVAGAIPAGTYFVPPANGSGTTVGFAPGPVTTTIPLSAALTAPLPVGATLQFTTPTTQQQFTALVGSVDLTAHQSGATAQAWAANLIAQAEPGSSGKIHGLEIDTSNESSNIGGFGVWLGNNGTKDMLAGYFEQNGVQGSGWQNGVLLQGASVNSIQTQTAAATDYWDHGAHANGILQQGTYSSFPYALYDQHTPNLTATQRLIAAITPQGGIIDGSVTYTAAASGGSYAGVPGTSGVGLVCSGTLASYTVTLPAAVRDQRFLVIPECTITALTITGPGVAVTFQASSSTPVDLLYDGDRSKWVSSSYYPNSSNALAVAGLINSTNESIGGNLYLRAGAIFQDANLLSDATMTLDPAGAINIGNLKAPSRAGILTGSGGFSGPVTVGGALKAASTVQPGATTLAALPAGCLPGQVLFVSDGRNTGEAAGAGTGTIAYCNKNAAWFANGAPVAN